uniref:SCP domain-containing protein n=1 Tax=Mesocestoides corti TaxID=53468 RepID=A0A5K3F6E7_MESCO
SIFYALYRTQEYSDELENLAKNWLKNCSYLLPHGTSYPEYKDVVDVIQYGVTTKDASFDLSAKFDIERKVYNYEKNICTASCAKYRRMVWSTASQVGCYQQHCERSDLSSQSVYIMACLYRPVVLNENERPYKSGTACSECPYGPGCERNQCTQKQTSTRPEQTTTSVSTRLSVVQASIFAVFFMELYTVLNW